MKKKNNKKSNKSVILGIIITLGVMVMLIGITYAYYRTRVIGNSEETTISTPTKMLRVEYQDDNPEVVTDNKFEPGKSVVKEFKVKNTGDDVGKYTIILDNIKNTMTRTWDIQYTLSEIDSNNKETDKVKGVLGNTIEKQVVYADIEIAEKEEKKYKLKVEYIDLDEDQSEDMAKGFSFKIDIVEPQENIFKNQPTNSLLYAIGRDNPIENPSTTPGKVPKYEYTTGKIGEIESTTTKTSTTYYQYGTSYEFDTKSGDFTINNIQIYTLENLYNEYFKANSNENKIYITNVNGSSSEPKVSETLKSAKIYEISKIETGTTEGQFKITYKTSQKEATSTETELSYTADDYGTSYYYRGGVENNYVTFASMCWRIVRVLGNGNIKIILENKEAECSSENILTENSAFINDEMIKFGDKFASGNRGLVYKNGELMNALDNWYQEKISENESYTKYIVKSNYCSGATVTLDPTTDYDREEHSKFSQNTWGPTKLPSLMCYESKPITTKMEYILNENIEDYIGTLNLAEAKYAGADAGSFEAYGDLLGTFYLGGSLQTWWLLAPYFYDGWYAVWRLGMSSYGYSWYNSYSNARPTITLSRDVLIREGDTGTLENPYTIE